MSKKQTVSVSYQNQNSWREIQSFLPRGYQLTDATMPKEECWEWQGNQIHLDTYRNPSAKAKVILFHGVGTNGRQMTTIIGRPLAEDDFEVIALDMPIYGETAVSRNMTVTFSDWVACGNDYVNYELSRDNRPIFLYGLSAGGMETYFVAAKNRKVQGIIGMTFLDQREKAVRMTTTKNWFWGTFGTALAALSCHMGLSRFEMKMSVCSKMNTLCNDENALKAMLKDKTSAGNKVNMKFLSDYMTYIPEVEPEEFDVCPIILTQPENDRWTPEFLSDIVLDKIKKVPVKKVKLRNGSHYPIEAEALEDLHTYILEFLNENLA
ncbi:MAG: alpha/beta hydrolase [Clostridiales bacterium]|nr:alpha/beta hydrolase [Clostridiales bacterium]